MSDLAVWMTYSQDWGPDFEVRTYDGEMSGTSDRDVLIAVIPEGYTLADDVVGGWVLTRVDDYNLAQRGEELRRIALPNTPLAALADWYKSRARQ